MLVAINSQTPGFVSSTRREILKSGGIHHHPTDTVYGWFAICSTKGHERVYENHRRDRKQPLSFICPISRTQQYARVSDDAYKIMRRLLPGLTPSSSSLPGRPKINLPKRQTTGIRVPDNRICQALVAEMGSPIISTSVKDEDGELLSDPRIIQERFGKRVDLIIDGGIIGTTPSSVISLLDEGIAVIREGKGDVSAFV
jgi:tRNA threonylcarbamoyl adenosine modification protein (Sua5/YciO/YrdC/YwlC family)